MKERQLKERGNMQINGYSIERGANLYGVNLRGADLTGANLRHANLTDVDLRHADLTYATYNDATIWPVGYVPDFSKMRKSS